MGNKLQCVRPSPEKPSRTLPNRFKVHNVNESGQVVKKGQLEVTNVDLILHVINSEPVKWPLRCLRRYGYDAKIFSFESGRRCATGPGIYAFKSKHASQIFQLVQENAQRTQENGAAAISANGTSAMRQRSLSSDAAPTSFSPTSAGAVVSRSSSHASGINGNLSAHPSMSSNVSYPPTSPSPLYFNQSSGSLGNGSLRLSPVSPTIQYVNASAFGDIPESPLEDVAFSTGDVTEEVGSHDASRDSFGDPALNYARLKLPSDEDNNTEEEEGRGNAHTSTRDDEDSNHGDGDDDGDAKDDGQMDVEEEDEGEEGNERKSEKEEGSSDNGENESSDRGNVDLKDSEDQVKEGKKEDGGKEACEEDSQGSGSVLTDKESDGPEQDGDTSDHSDTNGSEKTLSEESDSNLDAARRELFEDSPLISDKAAHDMAAAVGGQREVKVKPKDSKKKRGKVSDVERTALLQDVVNGNIKPDKLKERNSEMDSKYNILMSYANLTEQQVQDVLQKLESNRNDNMSPCTVCSTSSSNASQRVSPLSYYANLDTAGELPPNWQANGFQFYPELRTPRSTSSKGSSTSEFTFDVNRGSCSPVDHNYANLDTLPEVQPLRHSLSSSANSGMNGWMILQPPPKGKMNYIQLDFDENDQPAVSSVKPLRRSLSSSASSTPPKTPVSPQQEFCLGTSASKGDIYARIDIEKTVALANSHRQVDGDTDISTRRTRHDVWTSNKSR
ncbi:uncharacterized protein [Diadema antillarum]|uniref:uncharacterized protein n=1 Tax=Diadema antillarum TaxID=105358 RepID=UPI003A896996